MTDNELKCLDKNTHRGIFEILKVFLEKSQGKNYESKYEQVELDFNFKCLTSSFLEKRVKAITELKEI